MAKLGDVAVGDIVKFKVNKKAMEFIVVHQGLPGAMYDASCDGTWLLMKACYENRQWHTSNNNDYAASTIHSYLNGAFLNLFETNVKEAIKQVNLPYRPGAGYSTTVSTGAYGLSAKIFLLSAKELSFDFSHIPIREGTELAYFKGCADDGGDNKRVANLNGSAVTWWLRSPYCDSSFGSTIASCVRSYGDCSRDLCSGSYALRPALVLPKDLNVESDGSLSFGQPLHGGISGAVRNLEQMPCGVNGGVRALGSMLAGVNGASREIFKG